MNRALELPALDQIFLKAHTHTAWQEKEVPDVLLKQVYDLAKMGPTSANCQPARLVFVKSQEAKAKLKPYLQEGNIEKTMKAPVTAIIGYDLDFYENMPRFFPHADARSWFVGNEALIQETAFRNGTLQGAYLIIAARTMGLDCGPMSGFDAEGVSNTFFAGTKIKANFLCNLGYGDPKGVYPRNPRFSFEEACQVI